MNSGQFRSLTARPVAREPESSDEFVNGRIAWVEFNRRLTLSASVQFHRRKLVGRDQMRIGQLSSISSAFSQNPAGEKSRL